MRAKNHKDDFVSLQEWISKFILTHHSLSDAVNVTQMFVSVSTAFEFFAADVAIRGFLLDTAVKLSIVRTSIPALSKFLSTDQTLDFETIHGHG